MGEDVRPAGMFDQSSGFKDDRPGAFDANAELAADRSVGCVGPAHRHRLGALLSGPLFRRTRRWEEVVSIPIVCPKSEKNFYERKNQTPHFFCGGAFISCSRRRPLRPSGES